MNDPAPTFEAYSEFEYAELVRRAHDGDMESLTQVLEDFRRYLLAIASRQISVEVQAKISAGDLVQDSLIEAQRDFDKCKGNTRDEIKMWLRRILLNNLINQVRDWKRQKRDIDREQSLDKDNPMIDDDIETPSVFAMRLEDESRLTVAMDHLADDQRTAIEFQLEGLSWSEIGERMDRSPDAARKLWNRAVEKLSSMLT